MGAPRPSFAYPASTVRTSALNRATPVAFGTLACRCAPEKQRRSPGSITGRNSEAVPTVSVGSGTTGALDLPTLISSR